MRLAYLCLQATTEGQASYAHVHEIINGLRRRGWCVELFEPAYANSDRIPGPLARFAHFLWVQLRMLVSARPDVIYIRTHFASWPTAMLARLRRIPTVQEVNGPYEDLFIAWPATRRMAGLFKWLMRSQLRWANAVISITPGLAEWARKESGNPAVWVIPNGVNAELFRPDAPPAAARLPEEYVVFVGALAPWQGIETILRATETQDWPAGVKLVVLGDGAERAKVEAAADHGRVIYLGRVPYSSVPGIVARSLAALSPQLSLGGRAETGLFPLKVFEALACAVPVIVTDFPGMGELVRANQCGLVVPPGDHVALARAVRYVYEHPADRKRMGAAGREVVEREHTWDMRAAATDEVLRHLLRPGRGERQIG